MQHEIKSQRSIKVVVADEKAIYLKSLLAILTKDGITVTASSSTVDDWDQLINPADLPDIALISHFMAERDTLNRAKQLKEKYPRVKLIVLTLDYEKSRIEVLKRPFISGILIKTKSEPGDIVCFVKLINLGYIIYPHVEPEKK